MIVFQNFLNHGLHGFYKPYPYPYFFFFAIIAEGTGNSSILKNEGGISCKSISPSCLFRRAQPQAAVRRVFSLRAKLGWLRLRSSCPQMVISVHVLYFTIFLLTPGQLFAKPCHNASLRNISRKCCGLVEIPFASNAGFSCLTEMEKPYKQSNGTMDKAVQAGRGAAQSSDF